MLPRTLLGITLGLNLWAPLALADSAYVVTLTNGAKYRGELVESIPNDHLTLKMATGQVMTFPSKDVVASEEVTLSASLPSPPSGPIVHIDGPPSLRLERPTGTVEVGYRWPPRLANVYGPECTAPCDASVVPGEHRLAGPGYVPTSNFTLQGPGRAWLEPHMAKTSLRLLGVSSTIFVTAGAVMMPLGAILLAVGIPALVASTSSVKIHENARTREARVRLLPNGLAF
jgi:hypothetical protein